MPRKTRYYACVIELDPDRPLSKREAKLNPGYLGGMPRIWIEVIRRHQGVPYLDHDFSGSGSSLVRLHGHSLLVDETKIHTSRWGAISSREKVSARFIELGWAVLNPPPPSNRHVYVIELDSAVKELAGAKKLNPDADPRLDAFYVGQTGTDPKARFQQHLSGRKASKYVRDHGMRLRTDVLRKSNPVTELDALREEQNLAGSLRRRGYFVLGGH